MSSRICGQVLDSSLSGNIRWVALAIADHADTDGECVMKLANVTRATRLSETTCRAMMRRMEDAGMLTIERAGGGRISLMKIHPEKFDPASSEGSSSEGSKSEGSKSEGSGEVVRFGKSQEESGLQDSDGVEAGANGGENGAKSDAKEPEAEVCPSPHTPLSITNNTILESITGKGESAERGEGADARAPTFAFVESEAEDTPGPRGRKNLRDCPSMRPTESAVIEFVRDELGLEESDAVFLYANWQENGWRRSEKAPVRDWKACCRTWKAGRYFPSQKVVVGRGPLRGYRKIDYSKGF